MSDLGTNVHPHRVCIAEEDAPDREGIVQCTTPPRVCVCVVLLYTVQLGGQRCPLFTTSYVTLR